MGHIQTLDEQKPQQPTHADLSGSRYSLCSELAFYRH
jgi:hypothetical protein